MKKMIEHQETGDDKNQAMLNWFINGIASECFLGGNDIISRKVEYYHKVVEV